jgi:N-acetylmuramoyl-L-alanine amidase
MPTFLVEMGYMSNEKDDVMLSTEEYQQNIVQGMVDGLVEVARLRGLIE